MRSKTEAEPHEAFSLHPPKQSRSEATLHRIVEAAMEIMTHEGVEAATVEAIVNRAGASVGSFYARFPGKDDLVAYLRGQVWSRARERWDRAVAERDWGALPVGTVLEGVVSLLLHSLGEEYRRRRVLGQSGDRGDPRRLRGSRAFHEHVLETVTRLLLAREEEITHPDPPLAIDLGYRFIVGALREALELQEESGEGGGPIPEREVLGQELARLWLGYLAPSGAEGLGKEGEVDFFDPWG